METTTQSQNVPVSPFYVDLGANLRRTRLALGLSIRAVGDLSGGRFNAPLISGYERGTRRSHVETMCELAKLYGVPARTFLPDDDAAMLVPLDGIIAQLESLKGAKA